LSTLERKTKSRAGPLEAMPPLASFAERYDAGAAQVVWMRLVADLETPVSAYLKLAAGRPMSFLLESVEGGATRGRYSVIGLEPDLVWRAEGDKAFINRNPIAKPDAFREDPLVHDVFPAQFVSAYADMKQGEWDEYHRQVTDWERSKYLLAF